MSNRSFGIPSKDISTNNMFVGENLYGCAESKNRLPSCSQVTQIINETCNAIPSGRVDLNNNPPINEPGFGIGNVNTGISAIEWSSVRSCNTVILSIRAFGGNGPLPSPLPPSGTYFDIGTLTLPLGISLFNLGSSFFYCGAGQVQDINGNFIGVCSLQLNPANLNISCSYDNNLMLLNPGALFASITFMVNV